MKLYKVTIGWTMTIKANDMDSAIKLGRSEDGTLLSRTEKAVEMGEVKDEAMTALPFPIIGRSNKRRAGDKNA